MLGFDPMMDGALSGVLFCAQTGWGYQRCASGQIMQMSCSVLEKIDDVGLQNTVGLAFRKSVGDLKHVLQSIKSSKLRSRIVQECDVVLGQNGFHLSVIA